MSYAIPPTQRERIKRGKEKFEERVSRAKTRRGAIHVQNPAGTKLRKRLFKLQHGRKPHRTEV